MEPRVFLHYNMPFTYCLLEGVHVTGKSPHLALALAGLPPGCSQGFLISVCGFGELGELQIHIHNMERLKPGQIGLIGKEQRWGGQTKKKKRKTPAEIQVQYCTFTEMKWDFIFSRS